MVIMMMMILYLVFDLHHTILRTLKTLLLFTLNFSWPVRFFHFGFHALSVRLEQRIFGAVKFCKQRLLGYERTTSAEKHVNHCSSSSSTAHRQQQA